MPNHRSALFRGYAEKGRQVALYKKRAYVFITSAIVVFVLIPTLFFSLKVEHLDAQKFLFALNYVLIFLFILMLFLVVQHMVRSIWPKVLLASLAATYYLLVSFIMAYWAYTGHAPDPYFFADSVHEIVSTALGIFGWKSSLYAGAFLALGIAYGLLFIGIFTAFEHIHPKHASITCGLFFVIIIAAQFAIHHTFTTPPDYLTQQIQKISQTAQARLLVFPQFPNNDYYNAHSSENIFILILESGNALAINGNLTLHGNTYNEVYNPNMRLVAKDGTYFPFFWGNSIQSNRALENILCGVANNLGEAFSYRPEDIQTKCLPRLLSGANYTALFFGGTADSDFMNYNTFLKSMGFQKIYNSDIMKESDAAYSWGYDDCKFYQRVFEYLSKAYSKSERLLVVIEASSHHIPFDSKPEYEFLSKFKPSQNFVERYLNSFSMQDYCVGNFYDAFKKYGRDRSHLFILADHSWPVGVHDNTFNEVGAFNDNFLIPFVYVPPQSREDEFRIGNVVNEIYSQTDILPTVFELLNGRSYQNSFAFALHGRPKKNYEDCHVLTQPYNGAKIAIVRGSDKYIYSLADGTLHYHNLKVDWYERNPQVIETNMSYVEFMKKYSCSRFKSTLGGHEIFSGPIHIGDENIEDSWAEYYWKDINNSVPVGIDFSMPLDIMGSLNKLVVEVADVHSAHEILIDDHHVGSLCRTTYSQATCVIPFEKPVLVSGNSTLTIKNADRDDFIIYSVMAVR